MISSIRIIILSVGNNSMARITDIFIRHLYERCGVRILDNSDAELTIELAVDVALAFDGYRIEDIPSGDIRISGHDIRSLLYGIGKFLHDCEYANAAFQPGRWRGSAAPTREFRAIFLINHLANFYQSAPLGEVLRYLEDIAMWGYNRVVLRLDIRQYLLSNQSEIQQMRIRLLNIINDIHSYGLLSGLLIMEEGNNAGSELLQDKKTIKKMADVFQEISTMDIDFFAIMPDYQCTDDKTELSPLTSLLPEIAKLFLHYFPAAAIGVSMNGTLSSSHSGWDEFARLLSDNRKFVDYLIYDTSGELYLPAALKNGVPAGLPMLSYTELSRYATFPWGGYGVNPFPHRLQQIWDANKPLSIGGMPSSEGIFDDINKVVCAQFFWDDRPAVATVRDYISYYFGSKVVVELSRVVALMERTTPHALAKRKVNTIDMLVTDGVEEAFFLTKKAETQMTVYARNNWRWRLFFIRAFIDLELTAHKMEITELCNSAFRELEYLYHAQQAEESLRPPEMITEEL